MIRVRVTPAARESTIGEWVDGVLRLRVREKAEKGRANEAVAKLLAERLGVPPSRVTLMRGATAREKTYSAEGLEDGEIKRRLGAPIM